MDGKVYIFHYNMGQKDDLYWLILAKGTLFPVKSWVSKSPVTSREAVTDMISHPGYPHSSHLPRFHLMTHGTLEVINFHGIITP